MSHASAAPDLQSLIRTVEQLHPSQRLNFIRLDFQQRRRREAAVRIEAYLDAFPDIAEQDALDLIYHEIVLREELGDTPKPAVEEYVRRFPHWEDALKRQFMLHEALAEESMLDEPLDEPLLDGPLPPLTVSHVDAESLPPDQQPTIVGSSKRNSEPTLPIIPGYRIDSVLGKGAMGVVFKAWQEKPPRFVALKMILGQADEKERRRFLSETEAVGRLQHANIVQIFQVSESEGLPFFSMELASGGTLAKKLGGAPWAARDAATMMRTLAQAMHHAHQRSIVHRDLKPGNVLLTTDGEPKISDFGLAKQVDAPESHTISGAIIGTPSYMAPEQARAVKDIGPPVDIYALGAILYEMLTGRPPFRGETLWDTVSQVITDDPVPPRRLQPRVPIDLETVALKCLHKDPKRRYADADALAKDLGRFLDGVPIEARPVPIWERARMWARRRPMVAALLGLLAVVIVVGFSLVTHFWLRADRDAARLSKQLERDVASRYRDSIARADRDLFINKDLSQARTQLEQCNPDLRGWEWRYLARVANTPSTTLKLPALEWTHAKTRPEASIAAFAAADGTVVTYDLDTGEQLQAFDAGGAVEQIEWEGPGGLRVLTKRSELLALEKNEVHRLAQRDGLAIRPDGKGWAWAKEIKVKGVSDGWQILLDPSGPELPKAHRLPVTALAFDNSGKWLASGSGSQTGELGIGRVRGERPPAQDPGDGKPGEVILWNLESGSPRLLSGGHSQAVQVLAFNRGGDLLATGGDDQAVILWDVKKGTKLAEHHRHIESIKHLAFSPSGRHLASVDWDGVLHLWDLSKPAQQRIVLSAKSSRRPGFAWNQDDSLFALAATDGLRKGEVQVWKLPELQPIRHYLGHVGAVAALAFDTKKPRLITASEDKTVQVWDLAQEPYARSLQENVVAASWSADGAWMAWANDEGAITLWNARTQTPVWTRGAHADLILALAFTSDGEHLVSTAKDSDRPGEIKIWSRADGKELAKLPEQPGVGLLAPHPKHALLAVPGDGNSITLWDIAAAKKTGALPGHTQKITALRFHPDGSLVSASEDGTLKLWDIAKKSLRAGKQLDESGIVAATFWADRIAWVGKTKPRTVGFVKRRDLSLLEGELVEEESQNAVCTLASAANDARLFVGTTRGEIAIWDPAHAHRLLGLRSPDPFAVRLILPDPDGKAILSLGAEGKLLLRGE